MFYGTSLAMTLFLIFFYPYFSFLTFLFIYFINDGWHMTLLKNEVEVKMNTVKSVGIFEFYTEILLMGFVQLL